MYPDPRQFPPRCEGGFPHSDCRDRIEPAFERRDGIPYFRVKGDDWPAPKEVVFACLRSVRRVDAVQRMEEVREVLCEALASDVAGRRRFTIQPVVNRPRPALALLFVATPPVA